MLKSFDKQNQWIIAAAETLNQTNVEFDSLLLRPELKHLL